jgi:aldose 1-epimerase
VAVTVDCESFGITPNEELVERYVLTSPNVELSVLTYGGVVQALRVPDREGRVANVVLGFPTLTGYLAARDTYFGAIVGRYANRIARGRFDLDGRTHQLTRNEGRHHLHGGHLGFDKKVWNARPQRTDDAVSILLDRASPDGEEGYPGTLTTQVAYSLTEDDVVRIAYRATTSRPTIVNLTNHSLYNLGGESSPTVLAHELQVAADAYTPADRELIPTGQVLPVAETPLDLRQKVKIGERIADAGAQLASAGGFDHNYVLGDAEVAARLFEPCSGRMLELRTTEPGLQVYTGNRLDGTLVGTHGRAYGRFAGVALESQRFPDSPNHPAFPSAVLLPGETYSSLSELRFGVVPAGV